MAEDKAFTIELDNPGAGIHEIGVLDKDHIGGVRFVIGIERETGERWIMTMPRLEEASRHQLTEGFTAEGKIFLQISETDATRFSKFSVEVDTRLHPAIAEQRTKQQ